MTSLVTFVDVCK